MKVLLVSLNYTPEPTGIAPYSAGLAEGLAARGHDVHVITGIPHYPEWRNFTDVKALRSTSMINGVRVTRLKHYIPAGGTGVRRVLLELSFAAGVLTSRWGKPDVVLTVSPSLFASAVAVVRSRLRRRLPVVVWVQDFYSRGVLELNGNPRLAGYVILQMESAVLRGATGVVVIHHRIGTLVNCLLKVPSEKLSVIRNWAHVDFSANAADSAMVRQSLGWGDRPVVLHCGSMSVKQGLETVVRAAQQADREGRPTLFALMGDGSQRPRLERLAKGCRNIQLLPSVAGHELPAVLAAADVLLLNELQGVREMALPSKLTTYFTAGKPVAAAVDPDGTSADEIRTAGAGVLVTPGDTKAMLDVVDRLIGDPQHARQLGARGQQYAAVHLSREGALQQWEILLSNVAHDNQAVRRRVCGSL